MKGKESKSTLYQMNKNLRSKKQESFLRILQLQISMNLNGKKISIKKHLKNFFAQKSSSRNRESMQRLKS